MLDEVVERYVALRDKKAKLKAEYEEKTKEIDAAMKRCEGYLLNELNKQGAESVRTAAGTFYKYSRSSVSVADWSSFWSWALENEMWAMIEHRANKTAVEEYRAVHQDLPPGLNYSAEWVVGIRKPTTTKEKEPTA